MSVLQGERKPGKRWTDKDRAFALALTAYESDLCRGCGQPMSRTTGEHKHDFEVDTITCVACEELEQFKSSAKGESLPAGTKTFVARDG